VRQSGSSHTVTFGAKVRLHGASGFIYLISRLGVTGARNAVPADIASHVTRIRAVTHLDVNRADIDTALKVISDALAA